MSVQPFRRILLSLFIVLLGVAGLRLAAQQQAPGRTLGAGGEPISVNFLAVTADGKPVTDLKPEEVVLKVDGKARQLQSMKYVAVAEAAAGAPAVDAAVSLPPAFGINATAGGGPGRTVLLVVDNETLTAGGETATRSAIEKFVKALGPNDQVGLTTIPHGGLQVDITSDRAKLLAALPNLIGQGSSSEANSDGRARSLADLVALTGIIGNMANYGGSTDVVFLSSSLFGIHDAVVGKGKNSGADVTSSSDTSGAGAATQATVISEDEFKNIANAIAGTQVQFYMIEPEDRATSITSTDSPVGGLENLTGQTGGPLWHLALPGGETALDRVARETSGYYTATFMPDPSERNSATHQMNVSVSRKDVTVRARPDVTYAKAGAAAAASISAKDMLKVAKVYRDLPFRAVAFTRRNGTDPKLLVVAMAEPADGKTRFTEMSAALYDSTGKLVVQSSADSAGLAASPVVMALPVAPGTYRLRVAAKDSSGRAGTVDYPVDATIAVAGSLKVGPVVLGTGAGATFAPKFQFSNEPEASATIELYGDKKDIISVLTAEGVKFDVAKTVDGAAMPGFEKLVGAASASNEADKFIITAKIPLANLPPGDYVVRVVVTGQPSARVMHTLRKIGG